MAFGTGLGGPGFYMMIQYEDDYSLTPFSFDTSHKEVGKHLSLECITTIQSVFTKRGLAFANPGNRGFPQSADN